MIAEISIVLSFLIGFSYQQYDYQEKYFDVLLDHFSITDQRKFPIRYLINDKYWKSEDGPIFMYAGNEGDIIDLAQNTGFMWEAAEKLNALVVFAEHRYYGKSEPKIDKISKDDPKFLEFLSIEQVIVDYIDLLYELKNYQKSGENNNPNKDKRLNPVIAFGGSYGAMLAAWMRMKYPHVVEGVLASSAPILQFSGLTPCESFDKIVTNVFHKANTHCDENIRNLWPLLRKKLSDDNGKTWIHDNWKLCKPIKTNDDVEVLISLLQGTLYGVTMVNYPYPTSFIMPLPGNPIKEMCNHLNAPLADDKLLTAVFDGIITIYYNYKGDMKCFDWKGSPYGSKVGSVYWDVQTCSQLINPQCSDGKSDMFELVPWNYTDTVEYCYNTYKLIPDDKWVVKEFGGKDLRYASNIIFSNGLLDPWSGGGILDKDDALLSPSIIIEVIPDAAHHLDLRATNPADSPSVTKARELYIETFKKWIQDYHEKMKSV